METFYEESRQQTFKAHHSISNDRVCHAGDDLLVLREKVVENRIGKWVEPYKMNSFNENSRIVVVQNSEDLPHEQYSIKKVKNMLAPETASTNFVDELPTNIGRSKLYLPK